MMHLKKKLSDHSRHFRGSSDSNSALQCTGAAYCSSSQVSAKIWYHNPASVKSQPYKEIWWAVRQILPIITESTILSNKEDGFIHRMFKWMQPPIRLKFTKAISKAQGQFNKIYDISLNSSCFSHKHLYINHSWVGSPSKLFIRLLVSNEKSSNTVYSESLNPWEYITCFGHIYFSYFFINSYFLCVTMVNLFFFHLLCNVNEHIFFSVLYFKLLFLQVIPGTLANMSRCWKF